MDDAVDLPVIEMVRAMPGFPAHRRFALVHLDEAGVLFALRSLEDPGLRFLVVPPSPFFPDYAPLLDDLTVADLGIESADDALVLLVLTAADSLESSTANLRAPIVLNWHTLRACQVVLDTADLAVAAPLRG